MRVLQFPRRCQFTALAFDHDADELAAGGPDEPVTIWEVATGAERRRIERTVAHPSQTIAFHPRAPWLYVATSYGLTACNTETGELRELWGHEEFAQNVAVDPTGRRLIGARHKLWTSDSDLRWLTCVDISNPGQPVREWDRNRDFAELTAFFPDGTRFTSKYARDYQNPSTGASVSVREADTGEIVSTLTGEGADAEQLAPSPCGDTLVTRAGRRLYVFDLNAATAHPRVLTNDGRKHFTGLAFHPSGKYLAAASNDATIKLYDTATWEVARTFTWDIGKMRSVTFSPDGTLAAAGSDKGKVVVWDVDV